MHFNNYLERVAEENSKCLELGEMIESIKDTTNKIINPHIKEFEYTEHLTGLLLGNVQSGKTGQVFGIISAAADEGFKIFILLTTDNICLQQQTYKRALSLLDTFNICGEDDEIRFKQNNLRKPSLIIIKKNSNILNKWNGNLSSSGFCPGNPLFIIDDEADAASLNTRVNSSEISSINERLIRMRQKSSSSFYLQLTATPQAVFLQTLDSGWKPKFVNYFKPGKKYLGGNFFYSADKIPDCIRITADNELEDLLSDDEFPENGLVKALCSFLIISSHIFEKDKRDVSNFLIHPSIRINDHEQIAEKIGSYLNRLILEITNNKLSERIKEAWDDIKCSKKDVISFDESYKFIKKALKENKIKIIVMNSRNEIASYDNGINIVVGGNSLGRGVTFPNLNVVYYCRRSRSPQADTFWQHSRIFGYDRDPDIIRLFMPNILYKLFSELNESNNSIIAQVEKNKLEELRLINYGNVRPTRRSVVDQSSLSIITGGTNYFPLYPDNKDVDKLDDMLSKFDDKIDVHLVNPNYLLEILKNIYSSENVEWNVESYIECLQAYISNNSEEQSVLIVRRNRDIAKGTGTLLSPNDRTLGYRFGDKVVLTLYKITGNKGWNGRKIWIPNIKFPNDINFYKT